LKLGKSLSKGQRGQALFVDKYLNKTSGGFFVEAGAFNGEYLSNSIFLEVRRNWTGLLVEPNSVAFKSLLSKQRKAYAANVCLSKMR